MINYQFFFYPIEKNEPHIYIIIIFFNDMFNKIPYFKYFMILERTTYKLLAQKLNGKSRFTQKKCDNKSCLVMIILRIDFVLCLDYFM